MGLVLRFWLENAAIDGRGLLELGHPAHLSLWMLGLGMTAFFALATLRYQNTTKKAPPPKKSLPAALGCVPAIVSLALSMLQADNLVILLLSAMTLAGLVTVALSRFLGKTSPVLSQAAICVWMVMMLLQMYRNWSFDPQLHDYCFQLLAYVALSVASYQYAAMDGGMGSDRKLWFWSLMAAFLCITAMDAGFEYLATAVWVLSGLPKPRLRKAS